LALRSDENSFIERLLCTEHFAPIVSFNPYSENKGGLSLDLSGGPGHLDSLPLLYASVINH
jgi:hypothetical protein